MKVATMRENFESNKKSPHAIIFYCVSMVLVKIDIHTRRVTRKFKINV